MIFQRCFELGYYDIISTSEEITPIAVNWNPLRRLLLCQQQQLWECFISEEYMDIVLIYVQYIYVAISSERSRVL